MRDNITATVVFDALIECMSQDNNFRFTVTKEQHDRAISAIDILLDKGWQPYTISDGMYIDPSYDYPNDIEILALGEENDKLEVVSRWGGHMTVVDTVLNEVFDQ